MNLAHVNEAGRRNTGNDAAHAQLDLQRAMRKKQGMGGGRLQDRWRVAVAALYALAMLLLGFAHQPAALSRPTIDLSAFALPDGSLPELCLGSRDDTGAIVGVLVCDACLLVHGGGLLPTPVALPSRPGFTRLPLDKASAPVLSGRVAAAQRARAPPWLAILT